MRPFTIASSILLAVMLLIGCTTPAYVIVNDFNAEESAYILEEGSFSIQGSAFLRQRGGGVVGCQGNVVSLYPATRHMTEIFRHAYGSTEGGGYISHIPEFENIDSRVGKYSRKTQCDIQGEFSFDDLVPGIYYVETTVSWNVPGSFWTSNKQGGALMQRVEIVDGDESVVITS